ncbi:MBL fold metallo-hydrolase [Acinetobacter defluvii]|uniref:MBL fold metallo-hydrolase n=1 Tax=Acinetobacter defluvii TaxID=1871111 RepID=UPI003AF6BB3C
MSKTTSYVLFDNGVHKCIVFTSLVKGEGIQANQFLIINGAEGAIIDPGGDLTYTPLTMELFKYIRLENIKYVFGSHQDPDIITSMPRWLMHTKAQIVASKLWARFLPHLNSAFTSNKMEGEWFDRLIELPDEGMSLRLGNSELYSIPAHFLHSVGNFQFYDPISKVLFSGDLGASIVGNPEEPVKNMQAHLASMRGFHQRYMCSNKILRYWVDMVKDMDIEMIVPQHGAPFVGREIIDQFLDWLWDLPCGVDLMEKRVFRCPEPALMYG